MDQLEIVDISTLPRRKPLETPLCKKIIRTWTPKVQSVASLTKTPDPPVGDDVAPDTDSNVPPAARSPRQKPPQSIAPNFCQLEIVDISTLPRRKPLETPLCKKRIRTWTPKVQSVARSTKTPDPPADDNTAPDTDSHVPPVASSSPLKKSPRSIAPKLCQLEIVDISTLLRGKPIETPLSKNRKRASRSPCVGRSTKTMVPSVVGDATPSTNSCLTPAAGSPRRRPKRPNPKIEIVHISTLPRVKRARIPCVGRSTKTMVPSVVGDATPSTNSCLTPAAGSSRRRPKRPDPKCVGRSTKTMVPSVVGDATPSTNSCLTPAAGSSRRRPKRPDPKCVGRSTKTMVPSVVGDATPSTNSCLTPAAGSSRRRPKRPDPKKVKSRTTKTMVPSVVGDATPPTNLPYPSSRFFSSQTKKTRSQLTMPKPNVKAKVNAKKICKRVNNYAVEIPIQLEEEQHNNNQDKCSEPDPSKYVKTPKRVECQVCDKKFKYQCELKDHMRAHTGEKPFKCKICHHAFRRRYLLNRHVVSSHETDDFVKLNMSCAVCDQKFPEKEQLLKHLEMHVTIDDDNRFSCCVCGSKFQGRNYLIFHLKRHSDNNYTCKICKRKFKYKEDYQTHMDFHDMQKKQPALYCSICTAIFSHKNILDSHMRLHTGEKPFACDTCEQKFAFKVALVKHVCIDGERPYMRRLEPNICNKCNTQLPNQIKSQGGEKPSCETCKAKYAFEVPIATHSITEDTTVTEQNIRGKQINKIQTVKVERNETWIEVSGRMESETEIKREIERDEMESEDIGIAEVKIEIEPTEINEEF